MRAVGTPDEFAFINTPSSYSGGLNFQRCDRTCRAPRRSRKPRTSSHRMAFEGLGARPGLRLEEAKCPMLVVMAAEDDLTLPRITREIVAAAEEVELVVAPGGHFAIMKGGEGFETNVKAQIATLRWADACVSRTKGPIAVDRRNKLCFRYKLRQ
ncbi:hypothetical protein B0H10DRAFT_1030430 [Mycena sp. CBHHK59/15]|nr:hypothetical protein B0H10DRAFT_1030430 [Mycena sp. CBHHK59/15]